MHLKTIFKRNSYNILTKSKLILYLSCPIVHNDVITLYVSSVSDASALVLSKLKLMFSMDAISLSIPDGTAHSYTSQVPTFVQLKTWHGNIKESIINHCIAQYTLVSSSADVSAPGGL